jgi:hypothetical protein
MSLPLGDGVADDTTTSKKDVSDVEGMELTSSVTSQDVLMRIPEKDTLQNTISKQETLPSQSGKSF